MVELKGLEDWARGILATSKTELNRRFGTWKRSDEFSKCIEALPFFSRYRPVFRTISDETLQKLHQKLRGQRCEFNFWDTVLMFLGHPLPDEVAFDLIERDIAVLSLGHSVQSEAVFWRLTPLVDETILTLAKRFYIDSTRDLSEFQNILSQFPDHKWMLESLGHCSASSIEKRRAYEEAIENHPKRKSWFDINPNIEPDQPQFFHFDLGRFSEEEKMNALYGDYGLEKLLDIARDDSTPDEILRDLEELRGSKAVRFAARHTLRRREEADELARLELP